VQAAASYSSEYRHFLTGFLKDRFSSAQIQNQVEAASGLAGVVLFYETLWNLAKEKPAQRQSPSRTLPSIGGTTEYFGWLDTIRLAEKLTTNAQTPSQGGVR